MGVTIIQTWLSDFHFPGRWVRKGGFSSRWIPPNPSSLSWGQTMAQRWPSSRLMQVYVGWSSWAAPGWTPLLGVFTTTVMACIPASAGKASPCSLSCPELCFWPGFPQTSWVLSEQFVQSSRTAHSTCQLGFFLFNNEFAERKDTWNIFFFNCSRMFAFISLDLPRVGCVTRFYTILEYILKHCWQTWVRSLGLGRSPGGECGCPLQYSGL